MVISKDVVAHLLFTSFLALFREVSHDNSQGFPRKIFRRTFQLASSDQTSSKPAPNPFRLLV